MKRVTLFLAIATLICGASLTYAGERGTGATGLKERSTTGMGTHDSIQRQPVTYSNQNYPPQPVSRNPFMRADRDDYPANPYRN